MKIFFKNTLAVLVLYNEKLEHSNTFLSLNKAIPNGQTLDLFIHDNSPESQEINTFEKFNINYVHNPSNPGVSAAYNYGGEFANKKSKKWLLLLDQDTIFNENIFEEYWKSQQDNEGIFLFTPLLKIKENIILSPCKFNFYGTHLRSINFGINYFKNNSPINSGILVSVNAFYKAGGYNERVALDLSDHQFIERFKMIYKRYFLVNSIGLQNFSAIEDNKEKQLTRFRYYCLGIFNFETQSSLKKVLMIWFLVLKTFKKTITFRTTIFCSILIKELKIYMNAQRLGVSIKNLNDD